MPITLATKSDILPLMNLVKACIADMESRGIFQWNEFYPTASILEDDRKNGSLYLMKDDTGPIGMIVLNDDQSPEYQEVDWEIKSDKVLVIHRLAVHPGHQREGVGRRLMDFAEHYAAEKGYVTIRLDAYTGNPRALNLYERRGYRKAGEVVFPWRDLPFYCYEKAVAEDH